MKPDQMEEWQQVRAKGLLRYVLVRGVLAYGLPMFLAMTFVVNRDKLSGNSIGLSVLAWALGGALFGVLTWHVQERKFLKASGSAA